MAGAGVLLSPHSYEHVIRSGHRAVPLGIEPIDGYSPHSDPWVAHYAQIP